MTIHEQHAQMVHTLQKPGEDILSGLTPEKCSLMHMAMGIAGEIAELIGSHDRENTIEELGDLEFFLMGYMQILSIAPQEIALAAEELPEPADFIASFVTVIDDILDVTKRYTIYGKPIDIKRVNTILARLLINIMNVYSTMSLDREEVLAQNIEKLTGKSGRYASGKYSDEAANERADKA